jgi:XTP/dITP diphosphohydrolase
MVRALGGAPGVYSKRFAPGSDHDRNIYLLEKMSDEQDRFAEFVTVLCLFQITEGKPVIEYFEGRVAGRIDFEPRGTHGFGYDPVFIPDGHDHTFAELGLSEKQKLSHRGRALEEFKKYLTKERK